MLQAAADVLAATGGKVMCLLTAMPTWGLGRLIMRERDSLFNTDGKKKLYSTEHPQYKKVGQKLIKCGIGVDFFMVAPSEGCLDVATIGMF